MEYFVGIKFVCVVLLVLLFLVLSGVVVVVVELLFFCVFWFGVEWLIVMVVRWLCCYGLNGCCGGVVI